MTKKTLPALPHLSVTSLSTYDACGEQFRLSRLLRVPQDPAWPLIGGSAFHAVAETLDLLDFGVDNGKPRTFGEALELEIEDRKKHSDVPEGAWQAGGRVSKEWPEKEGRAWWLSQGPVMLTQWRRFLNNNPQWMIWVTPDGLPGIEIPAEPDLGMPVKGFIDRVMQYVPDPDVLMVLDLKSGKNVPKSNRQTVTYGEGIYQKYGIRPRLGSFYMARQGSMTTPTPLAAYGEKRLRHEFQTGWRGIQAGIFPANVGQLCNWCGVKAFCASVDGERAAEVAPWDYETVKDGNADAA